MAATGCDEVAAASIRAKGGSFPSIGVMDEPNDLLAVTKMHAGVCTLTRRAVEL